MLLHSFSLYTYISPPLSLSFPHLPISLFLSVFVLVHSLSLPLSDCLCLSVSLSLSVTVSLSLSLSLSHSLSLTLSLSLRHSSRPPSPMVLAVYADPETVGWGSPLHLTSAAHVAPTHPLLSFLFRLRFVSPSSVGMCNVIKN